jgi:uncharacterized membrane protein
MEEQQNNQEQPTTQADNKETASSADVEKNKTMAILAYFIFFLPLVTDAKDSQFARFHANQSLVLLISWFALFIIGLVPIIGWILVPIAGIALFVFWIMGLVNASKGEMKELPLIGGIHILDK